MRRIPNRATGADTGDTHPTTAQAHSPPMSRLPPRVLGDLCRNHFLFLFRIHTVVLYSMCWCIEVLYYCMYTSRSTYIKNALCVIVVKMRKGTYRLLYEVAMVHYILFYNILFCLAFKIYIHTYIYLKNAHHNFRRAASEIYKCLLVDPQNSKTLHISS